MILHSLSVNIILEVFIFCFLEVGRKYENRLLQADVKIAGKRFEYLWPT